MQDSNALPLSFAAPEAELSGTPERLRDASPSRPRPAAIPSPLPQKRRDPPAKPRKGSAEHVLRSFNTWAFKREQPSGSDLMLHIVSEAVARSQPISFVLYWGKGPRCTIGSPDVECFDYLASLAQRVREAHAPGAAIELIFTDTHAQLNGHRPETIRAYFASVESEARARGFHSCLLSEVTRAAQGEISVAPGAEPVSEETMQRLLQGAMKWYHGEGSPEQGAVTYYQMNMVEKRAVELAFPRAIFVTFNGSELRDLFPDRLPIFYMYSLRRGIAIKPWFLPLDAARCEIASCECID